MISKKTSIILLACTMVVINFFIITQFTAFDSRLVRNITTLAFFVLFIIFGGLKKIKLTLVYLLFISTDVCIMFYDYPFYNNLASVLKSLGLLVMIWHLIPRFKIELESKKSVVGSLLIIGFGGALFLELLELATMKFNNTLHIFLYACCALLYLILFILVVNYNLRYNSMRSIVCVFFVFSIALSDFLAFISYYLAIGEFYYPTRLFHILGITLLTAYAVLPFKKEELFEEN
ncbi:hypothetical protein ACJOV8_009305 [Formosa sp. 3Alg 14/1]|uniref:hypothetical protein n=1 Tax=unclassified Formosa TaxID=2644710 RepID=UPI0039BE93D0